ncbi:MAG TPA: outer membrane beta-barrel protein [Candidatus Saccharimonadales bacterium]|jgi:hypothetical protein|nr:outer membrane beta-barrel protein [Candidatus Saccharimonadales bacterium]
MKTRKQLFAIRFCATITLAAVWISGAQTQAVAQMGAPELGAPEQRAAAGPSERPGVSTSPEIATSSASNAEILTELGRMRARIQELEAQLKGQSATPAARLEPAKLTESISSPLSSSSAVAQEKAAAPASSKPAEPFAFADFTWLNGNPRTKDTPLDTKFFTGEFRWDTHYIYHYNHPSDHTLVGTSEGGRTNEFQVQHLGIGGDFHLDNVHGRVMSQIGTYSSTQPRNDATPGRGQFDLGGAYRYVSEAYGGYHIDKLHGINVDAGIFLSYIGLFSFYNFDNWAYQPSYVSSNTPWFFNGARIQIFPTDKLKVEGWLINGWQSYGTANGRPGLGAQVNWRPNGNISIISNSYGVGRDTVGAPHRTRWHSDDSIQIKYYDRPQNLLDKMAFSFTADIGCESGSGVSCFGNSAAGPKQSFIGAMVYDRLWFHKDLYAVTLGGGAINNPGRYLVLLPPINGATAFSGTPYFTENPGDPYKAWDASATFDYLPSQYITFRWEYNHRAANVPYFSGQGGVTPPGGNTGALGSFVPGFTPDLRKRENRLNMAILVKF